MNRIAQLRKAAGLSQSELAKHLGIAQNTLSQYENEVRKPTSAVIMHIADTFSVTPNDVLGVPSPTQTKSKDTFDISSIIRVESYTDITDVNLRLKLGFKLLFVGSESNIYDGEGYSHPVYCIGWPSDLGEAPELETAPHGDEYNEELYGWEV